MSITREQAATWFETMHPPGPAAREMYRMAAEALRGAEDRIPGRCEDCAFCDKAHGLDGGQFEARFFPCKYFSCKEAGITVYIHQDDFCSRFVPRVEAAKMAISALRPVSRERVEQVWIGGWIAVTESELTGFNPKLAGCDPIGGYRCSRCNEEAVLDCNDEFVLDNFCPRCGAAMTDEAVEMVMERINKMEGMKK